MQDANTHGVRRRPQPTAETADTADTEGRTLGAGDDRTAA